MNFQEFVKKSQCIEAKYRVTQDIYYNFQRISNDYNPLHTDDTFAKSKGFPQKVMYGNILNGFVSHFVGMALPSRDVMIQTQDIKYRSPVFLDDTILLKSEIDNECEAVRVVNYKLKFYRVSEPKNILVANGHVQIGLLE